MAIALTIYDAFLNSQLLDPIDFNADTITLAMVSNAYTPNASTHDFYDDVAANELETAVVGGLTATAGVLSGNNVTFAEDAGGWSTGRHLVLYDATTAVDATSKLIAFATYTVDQSVLSGDVVIRWNDNVASSGNILTLAAV